MKKTLVVLMLCAFAQGAQAKGPVCREIATSSERLACYDLASPPKPAQSAVKASTVKASDASRPPYSDPFIAEDARTTAKLKTICRGC